jgi:AraC family transcriptional regulator
MFYYITDMTLSEYIRKRKLSLAANRLQRGNEKIIDIALDYGYDSADSFTRAFAKQHGITPSAAREPGVNLTVFTPLTFQIKIGGIEGMNWRIEKRGTFEVFGTRRTFNFGDGKIGKISDFWTELQEAGDGIYERLYSENASPNIAAVCAASEPEDTEFPYMICALKTPHSDTSGFKTISIPESIWAVFKIETEKPGEVTDYYYRIYSEWLPSSGYERTDAPDMELYYKNYEEVWLPVKKTE